MELRNYYRFRYGGPLVIYVKAAAGETAGRRFLFQRRLFIQVFIGPVSRVIPDIVVI